MTTICKSQVTIKGPTLCDPDTPAVDAASDSTEGQCPTCAFCGLQHASTTSMR